MTECELELHADLYTEDFSGPGADGSNNTKTANVEGLKGFCAPDSVFLGTKFELVSATQLAWNVAFAQIKVDNKKFKEPILYAQTFFLTPCWESWKIRSEVRRKLLCRFSCSSHFSPFHSFVTPSTWCRDAPIRAQRIRRCNGYVQLRYQ